MDQQQKKYPAIQGLSWHRDQYYSFYTPIDWHPFAWTDDRQGMIYGPDPNDPATVFAVALKDLGTNITPDDLDVLAETYLEMIKQLPDVHIESYEQKVSGEMLELEAKYTFSESGDTRQCWSRVFYHHTRQITMMAQGATPEKYAYWLPMFFEAMMTAGVHSQKPAFDYTGGTGI